MKGSREAKEGKKGEQGKVMDREEGKRVEKVIMSWRRVDGYIVESCGVFFIM